MKLRLLPGQRVLVLNAPGGFLQLLGNLPDGVQLSYAPQGVYDFVLAPHLTWRSSSQAFQFNTDLTPLDFRDA